MNIKAFHKPLLFFIVFGLSLFSFSLFTLNVSAATNLISNPSAESGSPADWTKIGWGTNSAVYTHEPNGLDGSKSLKVAVNSYSNGDARWAFKDVAVTPNTQYTFSVSYKSNVPLQVDIDTTLTNNSRNYGWLGDIAASPASWTTVTYTFTTLPNAKFINIFLPVYKVGWIQTDNYSLTSGSVTTPVTPPVVTPPPTTPPVANGFKRPLISLDFDDGWASAYNNGFPLLNQFGFKGSAMIIADTLQNPSKYGAGYMTAAQIKTLSAQGHKINSHSLTHADLTTLNDTQLTNEIVNSKTYLEGLVGKPVNYFVTPLCAYNANVTKIVKQYYSIGMRNCDSITNTKVNYDKYNVKSFPILKTTSLAQIQSAINNAKLNNQWLVLMYHQVKAGTDAYSVTPATLRTHLQAIKDSGVTVLPSEDAIVEINAQ